MLEYIKENHYRPNVVAKGLAKSKTYNIGWVMPGDSNVTDLPFFQRCMMGISEVASFYNSVMLDSYQPAITSLRYEPKELGMVACRTLFDYIAGKEVQKKVLLGYEMILKGSTQ